MIHKTLILLLLFSLCLLISGDDNFEVKSKTIVESESSPSENKQDINEKKTLKAEEFYKFLGFLIIRNKVNCEFPKIDLSLTDFGVQLSGPPPLKIKEGEEHFNFVCDVIDNGEKYRYTIAFAMIPKENHTHFKTVKDLFKNRKITQCIAKRFAIDKPHKQELLFELRAK